MASSESIRKKNEICLCEIKETHSLTILYLINAFGTRQVSLVIYTLLMFELRLILAETLQLLVTVPVSRKILCHFIPSASVR